VERQAPAPAAVTPEGLYLSSSDSKLRLSLGQQEQKRVLEEVGRKVDALVFRLNNLHTPESDLTETVRTAVSPLPQALTMTADDQAEVPALHTIEVQWPAQGRETLSKPQNPIAPVTLDEGTHTFNFTIDGVERQVSVSVANNSYEVDDQEEFLRRLARAIDGVDYRISAEVESSFQDAYDPAPRSRPLNRVVRLKVTTTEAGQGVDYYFSDSGSGDLIQTYGLDAAPPQRSARMRLGGELRDQPDNRISIDNGHVTGQALGDTAGPVNVEVVQGPSVIESELVSVISKYNDLVSYLDAHADILRPSLKDRVVRSLEERARNMPSIGLRASLQGKLAMSPEFSRQVQNNFASVREVLLGDEGWAAALKSKLDQLRGMNLMDFALELDVPSQLSARQRAWDLVHTLSSGLINGYY
jgi:hypothetical protein